MKMEPYIKLEDLPKRPKSNSTGVNSQSKIITNYFPISVKPFDTLYIFKIVFEPKIMHDNRVLREKILNQGLPSIKQQIHNPVIGGFNIYSVSKPTSEQCDHIVGDYKINVKQVKSIDVKKNPTLFTLFLNNGIRNVMSCLKYIEIGQTGKFFKKNNDQKKQNNDLFIYPGFKVNFLLAEGGLFLRIDPAFKVVQNQTVLDVVDKIYQLNKPRTREQKRMEVKQALTGKIVMTNYGKTRYVKIQDIEFAENLEAVVIQGKQNMNILDYYQKKYQICIKVKKQPLLKIENKNKKDTNVVYMLPQLCLMTGYPLHDFDECKRKKINQSTTVSPTIKYETIQCLVKEIADNSQTATFTNLGIKIENKPFEVKAKRLKAPILELGEGNRVETGKQESFQLFSKPIYDNKKFREIRLALIYYTEDHITQMVSTFTETSQKLKVNLRIFRYKIKSQKYHKFYRKEFFDAVKSAIDNDGCNFCLAVLENQMSDCYPEVKQICLNEKKIMSQVVLKKNLGKTNYKSICTKVLLQIFVKAGCTLWSPSISQQLKSVMIASFDIKKYSTGKQKKAKLVGIASINQEKTQFASQTEDLQQVCDKFSRMVKILLDLLNKYFKRNQNFPQQIFLITDSCPKNQIQMYIDNFVPLFYDQIRRIGGAASSIKLTIIQTRDISNERFFQSCYSEGGRPQMNNPPAGIIVSNSIVSENYDFYMVSQKPRTGCTVPIHFNIINTNSSVKEELIHQLMYSQCFNYANFSGSIKVPSIIQYTKRLARFSAQVFKDICMSSEQIRLRLYYI